MIKEELRFADSTVFEGMTSISALLNAKAAGVNDRGIKEIFYDRAKEEKKAKELAFLRGACRKG